MNKPKVSIIIPTHNMKTDLEVCLHSLYDQTFKDFRIIVVDDVSNDGTREMLKKKFPDVSVISNVRKLGPEASRNIAIRNTSSKYIATLDADTWVDKKWLEELVKVIESHKWIGMCSCKILNYSRPNIIDNIGHALYYDFSPIHIAEGEEDRGQYKEIMELFGICLAGALVKRELFDKVGYFDETYGENFGDDEWTWRVRTLGYKCYFVPSAIMYHKRNKTKILNLRNIFNWEKNRIYSIIQYYPFRMAAISIFYTLKRYTSSLMKYRVEKPLFGIIRTILYAWYESFKRLPLFLKKRRENKVFIKNASKVKLYLKKSWGKK